MAGPPNNSGIDLERELTCSICTDVLYQPLTLLDCLHTFCGSCLKEWFSFQARSGNSAALTCPSCRAQVLRTRPNATVTTLLDMFLGANPDRGKSDEEKEDLSKLYKPGDEVLPKIEHRRRRISDAAEEEDRRIMDEVRQLSLQEVGVISVRSSERSRERRRRDRSRDSRDEGRGTRTATGAQHSHRIDPRRDRSRDERTAQENRRVEHQSSLRSLLSASDLDNQELQEDIMRQIMEEGLLDGIDWDNLNAAQEEEIAERIAQAYQRRQRQREGTRPRHSEPRQSEQTSRSSPPSPRIPTADEPQRRRTHGNSESGSLLPISRPRHLEIAIERDRRPRGSSTGSAQHSRPTNLADPSHDSLRQASRSATELSDHSNAQENGERRTGMAHTDRRATDPERRPAVPNHRSRSNSMTQNSSNPSSPRTAIFGSIASAPRTTDPASNSSNRGPRSAIRRDSPSSTVARVDQSLNNSGTAAVAPSLEPPSQNPRPSSSPATSTTTHSRLFTEPSISCNRCGTQRIEYDLHYNCPRCNDGKYNICLRCYRLGEGCLHWFGFGQTSLRRYEAKAPPGGYPSGSEPPHILIGHRYLKSRIEPTQATQAAVQSTINRFTDEDPSRRLQAGIFCANCNGFANACYWRCDICNEGEWGFCNTCVNQGKHCTHALLPLKQTSKRVPQVEETGMRQLLASSPPPEAMPQYASILHGAVEYIPLVNTLFEPLTFSTRCDICHSQIAPSNTRYHCGKCNKGDYDICNSCYNNLVASGRISTDNGYNGWRRCLRGHRMCVVGFEDRGDGRMRVVVRDLVGGYQFDDQPSQPAIISPPANNNPNTNPSWTWREEDGTWHSVAEPRTAHAPTTIGRYPPDGGRGMRVSALYGFWPEGGIKDELGFPKGAEIREVIDINGDWYFGVYCGGKGLFQGNYGRIVG